MNYIDYKQDGDKTTIFLKGHIDSVNAEELENEINSVIGQEKPDELILDAKELEYISSAGLRVILRLRKEFDALKIINVTPEVYEIFDMTGFVEMMDISKAYREICVDGCEVIGQGANGIVYRIDRDTIVKVYFDPDSLPEIHRERELARTAFILGVPTAIPYDVVRVGDGYGSVFELLNADSFAKLLIRGEKSVPEIAEMSIDLLKLIHSTKVKPDSMPDMKAVALDWAEFLEDYLPAELYEKLHRLVQEVPEDNHMMHGDYHIKNVMLQNGECLLIDMDTLCYGHPVFELASMYNAYRGFSELDNANSLDFLGIPYDTAGELWRDELKLYLGTSDEDVIRSVEEKAMIVGYTRLMRREIRRKGLETEKGRAFIENCRSHLVELIPRVDSLVF